MFIRFSFMRLY